MNISIKSMRKMLVKTESVNLLTWTACIGKVQTKNSDKGNIFSLFQINCTLKISCFYLPSFGKHTSNFY